MAIDTWSALACQSTDWPAPTCAFSKQGGLTGTICAPEPIESRTVCGAFFVWINVTTHPTAEWIARLGCEGPNGKVFKTTGAFRPPFHFRLAIGFSVRADRGEAECARRAACFPCRLP